MPDLTVIVPTHNRSRLLRQALLSVLWQRDVDLEVIVVDDGSSDDTASVVSGLRDARIRMVRHRVPRGVSAARNQGIGEARGDWVAFLDDDDLWAPEKLAEQLRAARRERRSWAYTGHVNVTLDMRVIGGARPAPPEEVVERLPRANEIPGGGSNVIVHRETLTEAGPFDGRLKNTEDWDMWIRLSRLGPPAWVCRPFVGYRIHPGAASLDTRQLLMGAALIESRYGGPIDWVALHRHLGRVLLRAGSWREALPQYLRAATRADRDYLTGEFRTDLGGALASGLNAARRRFIRRFPHLGSLPSTEVRPPEAFRAWRDEGEAWLRELRSV
jgi:glycosyltransferase involved in cell wall biosynthesis